MSYMRVPRATVMRRLERLQEWGLVHRHGHHYFMQPKTLNSLIGLQNYQKTRCKLKRAMDELSILDTQTE
jgi:DNA-binding IclR family transcriptional regulator